MHKNLPPADELPWTISYVIKRRTQIDTYNELSKEQRPPDNILWHGTPEDIEEWFDKVLKRKNTPEEFSITVDEDDIG